MTSAVLPCSPAVLEELRALAARGLPVSLTGLDALDPAQASGLLEFFLHDPSVTAPIEPFAGLLVDLSRKRETGLWDLFPREGGDAFLEALPRDHPDCMACACFPICQGYGAWAGSCETWRRILTGLAKAARDLARLRAQAELDRITRRGSHARKS